MRPAGRGEAPIRPGRHDRRQPHRLPGSVLSQLQLQRHSTSALAAVGLLAAGALAVIWVRYSYPGFDPVLHLAWGRLLAHGQVPEFSGTLPAIKHPYYLLISTVLAPLGPGMAMDGYLFVSALACIAVLTLVAAIGLRLGGVWTAAMAIVLTALSS